MAVEVNGDCWCLGGDGSVGPEPAVPVSSWSLFGKTGGMLCLVSPGQNNFHILNTSLLRFFLVT